MAYAEQILEQRGFFAYIGQASIPIDVLSLDIPFALNDVGGRYTEEFAARRIGQHIANGVVSAAAQMEGFQRKEMEKHLKLPLTRLRKFLMGREAANTQRFHELAVLLAEQLFGNHQVYQFSGSHPLNPGIYRLLRGVREYTDYKPDAATRVGAALGSAFATPVEYATLTQGGERDQKGGAQLVKAHATGGGVGLSEILYGLAGGLFLAGLGPSVLALAGIGAAYSLTGTSKTRSLHEITHAIQYMVLGSALNDGLITPEDFWQIMYDVQSGYAFAGGSEVAADIGAYLKVLGDMFNWFELKARTYFALRQAEGDEDARQRGIDFDRHLRNVRDILRQEGYAAELREAKELEEGKKWAKELAKQVKVLEERGHN